MPHSGRRDAPPRTQDCEVADDKRVGSPSTLARLTMVSIAIATFIEEALISVCGQVVQFVASEVA